VTTELRMRTATPADTGALQVLAERDSRRLPGGTLLVAESDGRILAAICVATGEAIADPFEPTDHLVAALRAHAAAPQPERREPWRHERPCAPQPAT
jgi:hypothetical protein